MLTCEHGGNAVPAAYASLFQTERAARALGGHRGMDIGALTLAQFLSRSLDVPLHAARVSRLLVDLNRSRHHPQLYSEFSSRLDAAARERLLGEFYEPYRGRIEDAIRASIRTGPVCHISVHSFAPRLGGVERNADIGLLYDPSRPAERAFCSRWLEALTAADSEVRVRRNYPYRGKADGLTTYLRRVFGGKDYLGIELEANQRRLREAPEATAELIARTLRKVII